jgi:hypothetical protein
VAVPGLDLMTTVDALEAEGRLLDAIDTLRAADAPDDDLAVARRLLHLRHEAFDHLDRDCGPRSWPPDLDDPFPAVEGPPELLPDELTTATVGGSILHHGSAIVRGLAPPATVEHVTAGIERSFAALDAWTDAGRGAPNSPWFVPFETAAGHQPAMRDWVRSGGGVWAAESPLVARWILELYHSIGMREVLAGYFGEAPAVSLEKLTLRKVGPDTIPSWHQDGSFLGDGIRSVNLWLALTDCGDNGDVPALEIVPRRIGDLLETGTCGSIFPNSIGHELVERVAGPGMIVRPTFRGGDALLFDERLVHRSAVSEGMTGCRYAVESWFFPASSFPPSYRGLAF